MTSSDSSSSSTSEDDEMQTPTKEGTKSKVRMMPDCKAKSAAAKKAAAAAKKAASKTKKKKAPPRSSNKRKTAATTSSSKKKRKKTDASLDSAEKAKKKREPNYTEMEDQALCQAYVNVSTDPIHGTHQKGSTFWNAIKEKYELTLPEVMKEHEVELEMPEQNADSLEQRYNKTIKKTMNKWAGYYKKAKTPLKSGWTEEMYREHACELYNVGEGSAFKLAHCVDILFQLPKFMPVLGDNGWLDEQEDEEEDDKKTSS
jgi:hypothetical protein